MALNGELYVLVAASLLPVVEALAQGFESLNPGVTVRLSAAGSSALREQVLSGAPADVFIPADSVHLESVQAEVGLAGEPVVVARNSLVLAVPAGNEAGVTSLADLARPELLIGLCAPEVPCGALALRGLTLAGIKPVPDTEEPNVRALFTKLAAGELDAAVVYASDTTLGATSSAASRSDTSDLSGTPDLSSTAALSDLSAISKGAASHKVVSLGWTAGPAPQASYAAAVLADAPQRATAEEFVAYLRTGKAQALFANFGFAAP